MGARVSLITRAESYRLRFPKYPPPVVYGDWLYGIWEIGNDYKGNGFYGSYPPRYLQRLQALFPDHPPATWLHLFSGALKATVGGMRADCNHELRPSVAADAARLPFRDGSFSMVAADPPYTAADAARYGTKMVNRRAVMLELSRVVRPGGFVAWLDCVKPQYRKAEWKLFGEIGIARSTNHRVRFVFLFERKPCA